MPEPLVPHQSFAPATPTAPSRVAADARGREIIPPRNREMRPAPPCARSPQGGVAAGIAGKHGHFSSPKTGWPSHGAEHSNKVFLAWSIPLGPFVGVQLSALDLQDGLNMEHRRHRSARRGHPAAFPQILQGVHRDVDAGRIPLRLQNVPGPPPLSFPGPAAPGRCGWTGPA